MRMRIVLSSLRSLAWLLLVTYSLLVAAQRPSMTSKDSARIKRFLRDYLRDSYKAGETMTRYFAIVVDLTDGGRQTIVYFTDQHSFCSSCSAVSRECSRKGRNTARAGRDPSVSVILMDCPEPAGRWLGLGVAGSCGQDVVLSVITWHPKKT
jgi:hypothetical protein